MSKVNEIEEGEILSDGSERKIEQSKASNRSNTEKNEAEKLNRSRSRNKDKDNQKIKHKKKHKSVTKSNTTNDSKSKHKSNRSNSRSRRSLSRSSPRKRKAEDRDLSSEQNEKSAKNENGVGSSEINNLKTKSKKKARSRSKSKSRSRHRSYSRHQRRRSRSRPQRPERIRDDHRSKKRSLSKIHLTTQSTGGTEAKYNHKNGKKLDIYKIKVQADNDNKNEEFRSKTAGNDFVNPQRRNRADSEALDESSCLIPEKNEDDFDDLLEKRRKRRCAILEKHRSIDQSNKEIQIKLISDAEIITQESNQDIFIESSQVIKIDHETVADEGTNQDSLNNNLDETSDTILNHQENSNVVPHSNEDEMFKPPDVSIQSVLHDDDFKNRLLEQAKILQQEIESKEKLLRKFLIEQRQKKEHEVQEEDQIDLDQQSDNEFDHENEETKQAALKIFDKQNDDLKMQSSDSENESESGNDVVKPVFDMFSDNFNAILPTKQVVSSKGENMEMNDVSNIIALDRGDDAKLGDNWDDDEGYYVFRTNEVMNNRYQISSSYGKGVFSTVLKAKDIHNNEKEVAIKVIRANELMKTAGEKELTILKELTTSDPENKRHIVQLIDHFEFRGHLCLVLEAMNMNLRKIVRKYGVGDGISLKAVRRYTKHIFVGLRHLHKHGYVHADLKPDNMVVNSNLSILKLCDFGSACRLHELRELETPYIQSRYYRAPEVILGYNEKTSAMDIWSAGVSVSEMFVGEVLFSGRNNNELLKNIQETLGKFPKKMIKNSPFKGQHFSDESVFLYYEEDKISHREIVRVMPMIGTPPSRDLMSILFPPKLSKKASETMKQEIAVFKDFLEKCLTYDISKRLTAEHALVHPFLKHSH